MPIKLPMPVIVIIMPSIRTTVRGAGGVSGDTVGDFFVSGSSGYVVVVMCGCVDLFLRLYRRGIGPVNFVYGACSGYIRL